MARHSRKKTREPSQPNRILQVAIVVYVIFFLIFIISPLVFLDNRHLNNITLFYNYVFAAFIIINAAFFLSLRRYRLTFAALTALWVGLFSQGFIGDLAGNGFTSMPSTPALRVVTYNWRMSNPDFQSFHEWVSVQQPDIVAIEEKPTYFSESYPSLAREYPYHSPLNEGDVVVLSRYPVKESRALALAGSNELVHAQIETPQGLLDVYAAHSATILDNDRWQARNVYLASVAPIIDGTAKHVVVLGDFNTSPWDPLYGALRSQAGLHAQPRLFPPVTRVLGEFSGIKVGSPIDHILVNDAMKVDNCHTASAMGSDHLPVMCDVYFD